MTKPQSEESLPQASVREEKFNHYCPKQLCGNLSRLKVRVIYAKASAVVARQARKLSAASKSSVEEKRDGNGQH
jgi:hypothetical protein